MDTKIKIKAYSKSELATMYEIHSTTFRVWLNGIPNLDLKPAQKILTPKQVRKVFEFLGEP